MNTDEIIEEYSKAERKGPYIAKLSKKLNVPKSTIIAELFKSGYKYEELKRNYPNEYNAALKKYEQWDKDGRPETIIPEHDSEPKPEIQEPSELRKKRIEEAKDAMKKAKEAAEESIIQLAEENAILTNKIISEINIETLERIRNDNEHQRKIIDTLVVEKADILNELEVLKEENNKLKKRADFLESTNTALEKAIIGLVLEKYTKDVK